MARARRSGAPGLVIPGLYAALLERERGHQARHDDFACEMDGQCHPRDLRLLDAMEAGRPAVLQGRRLRGHGLPRVPLGREQAFSWFAVMPDDRVVPAESPDDD